MTEISTAFDDLFALLAPPTKLELGHVKVSITKKMKWVFQPTHITDGRHFTIDWAHSSERGGKPDRVNFHLTWYPQSGVVKHETVGELLYENLEAAGNRFNSHLAANSVAFWRLLRPVRLGWLKRRGYVVYVPDDGEMAATFMSAFSKKRGQRMKFTMADFVESISTGEFFLRVQRSPEVLRRGSPSPFSNTFAATRMRRGSIVGRDSLQLYPNPRGGWMAIRRADQHRLHFNMMKAIVGELFQHLDASHAQGFERVVEFLGLEGSALDESVQIYRRMLTAPERYWAERFAEEESALLEA